MLIIFHTNLPATINNMTMRIFVVNGKLFILYLIYYFWFAIDFLSASILDIYWNSPYLSWSKYKSIKIRKIHPDQNTKNHKLPLLFILESLTLIDLTCCFNLKFSNLFMHLHSLPCPCAWLCKCPSWWLCVVMLCCLPLLKLWSLRSGDLKYIFDFTTECCGFRTDSSMRARRLL
jgi:hypothetical protein